MAYASSGSDDLRAFEEQADTRSITNRRRPTDESIEYKSKNLHAERRRRQKLSDRLLLLRATVPIITNMNKATIIEDAITYIKQLQKRVNILKDQLVELEGSAEKTPWPTVPTDSTTPTQLNKSYIQADVSVSQIDEHKLWIKILFEKRKGAFTKLIQAMNSVGFELTDTSVTTVQGAVLVTTLINGIFCSSTAQQTEDLLLGIVNACI